MSLPSKTQKRFLIALRVRHKPCKSLNLGFRQANPSLKKVSKSLNFGYFDVTAKGCFVLVQKMSHAREIKRDAVFIGCSYHFIIAYAATGLGYGAHAHLARLIYAVAERKKRLAR